MNIVRVTQGSPEWYAHRLRYRNASETPVVLGVSPFLTAFQLWQIRLGLREQQVTPAMQRGTDLESSARAAYERQTGLVMQPLVVVEGEYSCSLDGITLDGQTILEVKCPMKGRDSELWQMVAAGQLPECYRWQVAHQLMVTKAAVADVYVFDGQEGILLQAASDPSLWPTIHQAWQKFAIHLASKTSPPLAEGDVRERVDEAWSSAAAQFLEARRYADQAQKTLAEAKEQVVALASHTSETGGGVTVTRYWKAGAIDYKKIPELRALDLEKYRAPGRGEVRVTMGAAD